MGFQDSAVKSLERNRSIGHSISYFERDHGKAKRRKSLLSEQKADPKRLKEIRRKILFKNRLQVVLYIGISFALAMVFYSYVLSL
ncbi:hypothetical protein [Sediminitomix flava]|uniref:Uncharacterized protein n=1 Tax=Sediminitomix flava TaxID=379075 RepID=A0A315Z7U7_SEDFL|nr:hypothetical protein [Sediminitomix flava]PWJ41032.1 hypothetical protein BC781_104299 [Sediminitomix flava]